MLSLAQVTCAYFGPAFQGWASQPGLLTLEGMLSTALQPLMPAGTTSKVSVSVAGRTDKGVSAAAQAGWWGAQVCENAT